MILRLGLWIVLTVYVSGLFDEVGGVFMIVWRLLLLGVGGFLFWFCMGLIISVRVLCCYFGVGCFVDFCCCLLARVDCGGVCFGSDDFGTVIFIIGLLGWVSLHRVSFL